MKAKIAYTYKQNRISKYKIMRVILWKKYILEKLYQLMVLKES